MSITKENLLLVKEETIRLQKRIDLLLKLLDTSMKKDRYNENRYASTTINDFPKERGAIRRASMDLTRVLADLRKSDN